MPSPSWNGGRWTEAKAWLKRTTLDVLARITLMSPLPPKAGAPYNHGHPAAWCPGFSRNPKLSPFAFPAWHMITSASLMRGGVDFPWPNRNHFPDSESGKSITVHRPPPSVFDGPRTADCGPRSSPSTVHRLRTADHPPPSNLKLPHQRLQRRLGIPEKHAGVGPEKKRVVNAGKP